MPEREKNYVYPTVGNDPEVFITNGKGKIIPAEEIGLPMHATGKQYEAKVDNAAAELNFPPSHCLQTVNVHIGNALEDLKKALTKRRKREKVLLRACATLDPKDLENYGSLLQFGCEPSLQCYNGEVKVSIPNVDPLKVLHRSTGFHVHLGMKPPEEYRNYYAAYYKEAAKILHTSQGRARLVQMCDLMVGLPAVFLERDSEAVYLRRNVLGYGKAGEYREQPWGFEYRTLGPWPMISPTWAWWANASVRDCLQLVLTGIDEPLFKKISMKEVADAINNNDLAAAIRLWPGIKRGIADLVKDEYTENSRHIVLSLKNLRLFEFSVVKNNLQKVKFSFVKWLRTPSSKSEIPIRKGFPEYMHQKAMSKSFLSDFQTFCAKWNLTRDNISGFIK